MLHSVSTNAIAHLAIIIGGRNQVCLNQINEGWKLAPGFHQSVFVLECRSLVADEITL